MPRTAKRIPDLDLKLAGSNKRVKISGKIGSYSSPELLSHISNENSSSTAASAPSSSAGASELQLKCFRISGVPLEWSDHDLLSALRSLDQSLEHLTTSNVRISLYRACCGSSQTALLNLTKCPEHFQHIQQDVDSCVLPYGRGSNKEIDLLIDSHFYGFTPLNTPEGEAIADVIAVTGLAGHAFGSWRNRESHKMWLQDFLPHDIKNVRIMTYGYNTKLVGNTLDHRMLDYGRDMIQQLEVVRGSLEERNRPIIFLGHSLGGILILQTLLQLKNIALHRHILDSTRAILFFGTPHQGLQTAELEAMVEDISSSQYSKLNLLCHLRENSEFLETHRDGLVDIWNGRKIFSFYETAKTPTVKKSAMGDYKRDGKAVEMVKKISAQLFLPNEHRIPVQHNHTDMVKYIASTDSTYQTVVKHIRDCVNEVENEKKTFNNICTADIYDCLRSLRAFDVESYRDEIFLKRYEDTCAWIFSEKTYQDWVETNGTLWIRGGPGCGKSVLSSFLSKELSGNLSSNSGKAFLVAYFFCDDKDDRLRTADAILANILAQVLKQAPKALVHFSTEPQYAVNKGKMPWNLGMLWRVFDRIVKDHNIGSICLIIDALDECEEESREKLLVRLKCLWNDPFIEKRVKVIITSRPHIPVTSYLPNVTQISLDASNLNKDITAFVTTEVPKLPCVSADSDLGDEIRRVLISNSDGMFLWVSLILDDLKNSTTTKRRVIREKLKALPKSLPDVYKNILRRIRGEDRRTAKTILQWIVCAIRPLTLQELTIAIAVRPEDTSIFSIWDEMQTNIQSTLQSLFGPLLRIEPGDSTVHLIHQSAKDFLSSTNLKEDNSLDREISHDGSPSGFYICPTESNLQLAIVCLNYLSFDEFEGGPLDVEYLGDLFQCHTFLKYAAIHWLQHVRQSNQENSDLWRSFWKLAQFTPRMALAYQVFCFWKNPYSYRRLHEITPLGIAAASGFTCFVKGLLDNGADVNGESGEYGSALRAAVVNGHETVVELLLSKGAEVDPDSDCLADSDSGGALYEAVSRRKTSMANKLLEAGADANGPAGFDPGTILSAAVVNKDEAMVKRLLDAGADVNDVWVEAGSVLVSAILHSSCDIVGILLKAGADVNTELDNHGPGHPDYCLGNALHAAALYGHDAVVKMLLEAKANVNALGGKYGNALTAAAAGGHEVVVKMLLGAGADANAPGGIYGSALIAAANNGHKMVVDMLLGAGADANASGPKHQSALAAAAAGGYEVVVKTLLGAGADVNAAGGIYGSALIAAANNGHEAVVDMLLGAGVDANASGPKHQNALAAAVAGGHEVVIEMLLGAGVDANTPGSSVLITAANMGHGVVVERLLKAGANVNTQEGKYGTALIAAAGQGNMKIVAMLLGAKADPNVWRLVQRNTLWDIVDSEQKQDRASKLKICTRILDRRRSSRDRSEYTKEVFAVQQQWKREAVEMLLGTGSSGTPNPTIKYQSALQAAAKGGSEEVLEKLLEAGADVNSVGGFYGSALAAAAANGRKKIVEMLLEAGADINSVGGIYGTPLQAAAANKHKDLVARLLEARADVNIRDGMYGGALVAASWTGKVKMVNMLLEAKADINIQALQAAVDGHRKNLEELLRSRINTKPKDVTDISLA